MPGVTRNAELAAIARAHLPAQVAEKWISLLRPGVRLAHREGNRPVAGRLGGNPLLPLGVAWPAWEGHGPLSFITSIDCAVVSGAGALDIAFPTAGTLLFFYFDGQADDNDAMVFYADPVSQAGAAVIYVPSGTATAQRTAPEGIAPYPCVELCAVPIGTEPGWGHRRSLEAFARGEWSAEYVASHPTIDKAFTDAVSQATFFSAPRHRIGGWAVPVQGPIEYEIASASLGGGRQTMDAMAAEETAWVLLAQFDSDDVASMMWGDVGTLYWMIRPEDLATQQFDKALFTSRLSRFQWAAAR